MQKIVYLKTSTPSSPLPPSSLLSLHSSLPPPFSFPLFLMLASPTVDEPSTTATPTSEPADEDKKEAEPTITRKKSRRVHKNLSAFPPLYLLQTPLPLTLFSPLFTLHFSPPHTLLITHTHPSPFSPQLH